MFIQKGRKFVGEEWNGLTNGNWNEIFVSSKQHRKKDILNILTFYHRQVLF